METRHKKDREVTVHKPVLLQEVITVLAPQKDDCVIDGTLGGGGHAQKILQMLGPDGRLLGIDADKKALERTKELLGNDSRVSYVLGNFRNIDMHAASCGLIKVDKILLDIGFSSDQLEEGSGRGFSYKSDGPLQMTFSQSPTEGSTTAWHVVNEWSEESLQDIIFGFGEEKRSKKIARAIVSRREENRINTSKELAEIIEQTIHRRGKIHPATKTFQAIRMAVNDELSALTDALNRGKNLLSNSGRIAVISFHSLEDRIVKRSFHAWEKEGIGTRITKKPIVPTSTESRDNKRARSAKLRCFKKNAEQ